MQLYNKIMLYFWLFAAIVTFLITTYMSMTDGIKKWGFYYIFVVIALMMFVVKKWMMNRMEKHLQFLEEKKRAEQSKN
jgi:Ca2+/H+ antiporter